MANLTTYLTAQMPKMNPDQKKVAELILFCLSFSKECIVYQGIQLSSLRRKSEADEVKFLRDKVEGLKSLCETYGIDWRNWYDALEAEKRS